MNFKFNKHETIYQSIVDFPLGVMGKIVSVGDSPFTIDTLFVKFETHTRFVMDLGSGYLYDMSNFSKNPPRVRPLVSGDIIEVL